MGTKRYITIGTAEYNTTLKLSNGKTVNVDFRGKNLIDKYRYVDVKDPLIQEALEKNRSFGFYFTLLDAPSMEEPESETVSPEEELPEADTTAAPEGDKAPDAEIPEGEKAEAAEETNSEDENQEAEQAADTKGTTPEEKVFPTALEAKTWLNTNHRVPLKRLANKAMIVEEYKLLGFDVKFLTD